MTGDVMGLVEERGNGKVASHQEYEEIHGEIGKLCGEAREA